MSALATLRERAHHLAVTWTTAAGLALVAPLEHSAGLALHLGWWHAWTLTALIEGAAGSAILAGRLVPAALALTGSSVLLGTLQSAGALPRTGPGLLAAGITLLAVASLLLVHRVRAAIERARAVEAAREDERVRAERAQQAERDRQRAEEAELSRAAEHARAMERERAGRFADQDRFRAEAEIARARAEEERARSERERSEAAPERSFTRSGADDITTRRARAEWERAEASGTPLTGTQLGALLGVRDTSARRIAQRWRGERTRQREGVR